MSYFSGLTNNIAETFWLLPAPQSHFSKISDRQLFKICIEIFLTITQLFWLLLNKFWSLPPPNHTYRNFVIVNFLRFLIIAQPFWLLLKLSDYCPQWHFSTFSDCQLFKICVKIFLIIDQLFLPKNIQMYHASYLLLCIKCLFFSRLNQESAVLQSRQKMFAFQRKLLYFLNKCAPVKC